MTNFRDLFEYNKWANEQVLAVTGQMTDGQLRADMPELGGSALGLMEHYSLVEAAFLGLITQDPSLRPPEPRDYAGVKATFERTAQAYLARVPDLEKRLGDSHEIPWFKRTFTIEQCLLQVATHSVQHRAGVCAGMARAGKQAPDLDYIIWLNAFR